MLNGNMCCSVWKEFLILRVGPDLYQSSLAEPCVREFDITGRAMTGWVMVEPAGFEDDQDLKLWVGKAASFAGCLPPKEK